jgi:small GTP-binding protein
VGKTSIIRRYIFGQFNNDTMSTIGVNFSYKEVSLDNKSKIKLKFIDTAGQEKYQSLSKSYFKNADYVCLIYFRFK